MLAAVVAAHFGVTTLFVVIVGGGVLYLVWSLRIRPEADRIVPPRGGDVAAPEPAEGGP
jgi:hypothetical protein